MGKIFAGSHSHGKFSPGKIDPKGNSFCGKPFPWESFPGENRSYGKLTPKKIDPMGN